jgi:signal transduction histidine kinase/CheY-like chemotaxis protein
MIELEGRAIVDPDGIIRRVAGTTRDVTELRLLERQLAQAQKMEAIGTLTGGLAHDFNNVLAIVIGNLDLLQPLIADSPEASELSEEALDGALRCAALIKRLLAFARRQPLHPQPTDVNALVREIGHLLGRTLGEDITLLTELEPGLWPVMVDPVQLQAALVNLSANARDAMPTGGQLLIATSNLRVTRESQADHPEAEPGDYAQITVRDNGTGIPADVIGHIFEPFFSTKGAEKGSGLGLSMVFGFVKQSGGHLSVHSEPGDGASFQLYLPRTAAPPGSASHAPAKAAAPTGDEMILVVEDNAGMRRTAVRQLSMLGYRVREAEDASAALAVIAREAELRLLLTDLVLSGGTDGLDLALEATRMRPGLRVVLMSGYPGVRDADSRLGAAPFPLLAKPFFADDLAVTVRRALAGQERLP